MLDTEDKGTNDMFNIRDVIDMTIEGSQLPRIWILHCVRVTISILPKGYYSHQNVPLARTLPRAEASGHRSSDR
jgi:hypothetical protein